jgi:hypothetical protein
MKLVQLSSTVMFYFVRLLAVLYLLTGFYTALALLLHRLGMAGGLISIEGNRFVIFYPAGSSAFLMGDYTFEYLSGALGVIFVYGTFFWLLGDVLSAFRQSKLFTHTAVRQLTRFYVLNLIGPPVVFLLMLLFSVNETAALVILFLHFIIGIFSFFMAAIFKQGLSLQEQQDFTI